MCVILLIFGRSLTDEVLRDKGKLTFPEGKSHKNKLATYLQPAELKITSVAGSR